MNYNDVQFRLKLIYSSINCQNDYEEVALRRMKSGKITDKGFIIFSFSDENDEPDILNQINSVISNLAHIKDCLKNNLLNRGDEGQLIESEIDNSIYLQLIIDLANQQKHKYPLSNTRSKKNPLIKNVSRVLTISDKPDNILYKRSDGSTMKNCMIKIVADVTDSKGNHLFRLDELIDNALIVWENIIKKYNII